MKTDLNVELRKLFVIHVAERHVPQLIRESLPGHIYLHGYLKKILCLFSPVYKILDNFGHFSCIAIGKESFDQNSYIMGVFLLYKLNVFLGTPVKVNFAI